MSYRVECDDDGITTEAYSASVPNTPENIDPPKITKREALLFSSVATALLGSTFVVAESPVGKAIYQTSDQLGQMIGDRVAPYFFSFMADMMLGSFVTATGMVLTAKIAIRAKKIKARITNVSEPR